MSECTDAASADDSRQSCWLTGEGVDSVVVYEVPPLDSKNAANALAIEGVNHRARGSAQHPCFASIEKDGDDDGVVINKKYSRMRLY